MSCQSEIQIAAAFWDFPTFAYHPIMKSTPS